MDLLLISKDWEILQSSVLLQEIDITCGRNIWLIEVKYVS